MGGSTISCFLSMFSCWVLGIWDIWWLFENVVLGSPKPSSKWTMIWILASILRRLLHSATLRNLHVGYPSWCTFSPINLPVLLDFTADCNPFITDSFILIWNWKASKVYILWVDGSTARLLCRCHWFISWHRVMNSWVTGAVGNTTCAEFWVTKGRNELGPLLFSWHSGVRYL